MKPMKSLLVLMTVGVAACGKGDTARPDDTARAKPEPGVDTPAGTKPEARTEPDPACVARTKELEPWLAQLKIEQASHEIDFGFKLTVIERAASPVEQKVDYVMITPIAIEAFDVSEADRADTKLGKQAAQQAVVERLATIKGMVAGPDERNASPDDRIRFDVDQGASWADVSRAFEAAAAAGYKEAVFGFTATSTLTPPAGVDLHTMSSDVMTKAGERLEELRKTTCKPMGGALMSYEPKMTEVENARERARRVAAALVECNCAADPGEIRALMWQEARWHQATPRVGITVKLGGDSAQVIEQPKATLWSEAHKPLLALAADGAPAPAVKLVSK